MKEIDRLMTALEERTRSLEELKEAVKEVIRISDRKHEAWDRVKNLIGVKSL